MQDVATRTQPAAEPEAHRPFGRLTRASAWYPFMVLSLLMVVLALAAYAPALFGTYGRLDDYVVTYQSRAGVLGRMFNFWLDSGRPVTAIFGTWLFAMIDSVQALSFARLVATVLASIGGAIVAFVTLRLSPRPRTLSSILLALCVGVIAVSTAAVPAAVTWAIMAPNLIALPIALSAGLAASTSRSTTPPWWVVSGLLVLIAAFTYQHYAPMALFPLLLWTAYQWATKRAFEWVRVIVMAALPVGALLLNVLFVVSRDGVGLSRMSDVSLDQRLRWFALEFMPRTIDFSVPWSWTSAGWSALILLLMLLSPALVGGRFLALPAAVVASWLYASLAVFPGELWASYRLVSAAQFVIWSGAAACAAFAIAELGLRRKRLAAIACAGLISMAIGSLLTAGARAYVYLAVPNSVDWQSTVCKVSAPGALRQEIGLRTNHWSASTSNVVTYDDYGIVASSVAWAYPYSVWMAADETPDWRRVGASPADFVVLEPGRDPGQAGIQITQDLCGSVN